MPSYLLDTSALAKLYHRESGLTLVVVGREDEAYLEVGGIPRGDDRWEGE